MTLADILPNISTMGLPDLQELNRHTVHRIRQLHAARAVAAAAKFKIGDLVEFVDNRRGQKVRIRISRINTKTLSGNEVDGIQVPWRVPPTMCRLVGA